MKRSLLPLVALAVVAALALLAWRWLAPHAAPVPVSPPPVAKAEMPPPAVPPPATASPIVRAERGEEALPPAPLGRDAAIAAMRSGAREVARLPVELSVVDRTTREPLRGVELAILSARSGTGAPLIVASLERPPVARGDSPLTLPATLQEGAVASFLVRAPGHASASVSIDFRAGGAREVRLAAACELDLMVDAPPGDSKYVLELRRIDQTVVRLRNAAALAEEYAANVGRKPSSWAVARRISSEVIERLRGDGAANQEVIGRLAVLTVAPWIHAAVPEEWTRFDRLEPGDWIATVVAEGGRDAPLAAAFVHLDAGDVERRTLVPKPRPPVPTVTVHGTVELAPEWGRDDATRAPTKLVLDRALKLAGLPPETSHRSIEQFEPAGGSRFTWSAEGLATGAWVARLPQFGVAQEFQLSEAGANEIALVVGAPCDVELALVDARTRASVDVRQITIWSGDGEGGNDVKRVEVDTADKRFRFRAAPGKLHVHVDTFGEVFFITERSFDLVPGRNELLFELHPTGRVRPRLVDGTAVVPWSDDYRFEIRAVGGAGGLMGWTDDGTGTQLLVAPGGRYTISVDDVPGFDPSGPVEFEVAGGGSVDVAIPLKRSK